MSDQRKPDALYVPHALATSPAVLDRVEALTRIAREHLGIPDGPPPAISPYAFRDGVLSHFVRKSLDDSMLFPTDHPRAGEVRHDWADGPDGVKYGYSKDG